MLFPGPSLVGWTQKYCVTQPKNYFPCLPPFIKGKTNRELYALMAPSQVLKCHFWGAALPRAGCKLQGNTSLCSPSLLWWWAFSIPCPPSRGPVFSDLEYFPHPRSQPLRTENGLELPLAQWWPMLGCWVSVPALGGAGAGAFQPREPPKRSFPLPVAWCSRLCLL